jgi:hypothetical protein
MVVRALLAGSITSGHRQASESNVVHDHVRLGQHQIIAVAYIGVHLGARHMELSAAPAATASGQRALSRRSGRTTGVSYAFKWPTRRRPRRGLRSLLAARCREAPAGSAYQVKGLDRRGPRHQETMMPKYLFLKHLPGRPEAAPSRAGHGSVGA